MSTKLPIDQQDIYLADIALLPPLLPLFNADGTLTEQHARYLGAQAHGMIRMSEASNARNDEEATARIAYRTTEGGISLGVTDGQAFMELHQCSWPQFANSEQSRAMMTRHLLQIFKYTPLLVEYACY